MKRKTAPLWLWALVLALSINNQSKSQLISSVTVAEPAGADKLNPLTNLSATGSYVSEYLYFSLLGADKASGEFVPLLAEALPKASADLQAYTYTLHPQARFNSGKKITAEDVVFSLKLIKNPKVEIGHKRGHYQDVVDIVSIDSRQFKVLLSQPSPHALRITGGFPIFARDFLDPDHTLEPISLRALANPDALTTDQLTVLEAVARKVNAFGSSFQSFHAEAVSGPYLLGEWKRNERIVLQANKKWWGKKLDSPPNSFFKQNAEQITFKIMNDEAQIRSAIFNRSVDLFASVPPSLYYELSDIPSLHAKFDFHALPGPSYEYIGMNNRGGDRGRKPLFHDAAVRRAFSKIVNVDLLQQQVNFGLGERISAECPTKLPGFKNEDLPPLPFDLEEARQEFEAAGWKDSDGNGLVDKQIGGEEVQFVAEIIYNANAPHRRAIATHVQEMALKSGILVTVVELPWKEYLSRLQSGDFDLYVGAWVSDPNEDSFQQIWHSSNWGKGSNFVGFGNSNSDHLIEAYDSSIDPNERKVLCRAIQQLMYDEQPYVFLWARQHSIIMRKNLQEAQAYNLRPGFWIAEWEP